MSIERVATAGQDLFKDKKPFAKVTTPLSFQLPNGERLNIKIGNKATAKENKVIKIPATVGQRVVSDDGHVVIIFDKAGPLEFGIPGDDITFDVHEAVTPTPTPIPTPTPTPTPTVDLLIRSGENISQKLSTVHGGTQAQPLVVGLERGGSWTQTLSIKASHLRFVATGTGAAAPVIKADVGVSFANNVKDVKITGIDFVGNGDKGDGVSAVCDKGCEDIEFEACSWRNFNASGTWQLKAMAAASRADHHKRITYRHCRLMDTAHLKDHNGHGLFLMNVDDFTFEENLIDGAGFAPNGRSGYVHGIYAQHGNAAGTFRRNIFSRCSGCGIQARGPYHHPDDPDTGLAGPIIEDNVFVDCAIAIMPNGPRARLVGNVGVAGHFETNLQKTGWVMQYASVGKLESSNNVFVGGHAANTGSKMAETIFNHPRDQHDADASGKLVKWEWNRAVNTTGSGNLDASKTKTADLSSIVAKARNRIDAAVVQEARQAVRTAAGL